MAIRPSDFQGAIWQSAQNAPLTQRAEDAPRAAQAAAQASFASQVEARNETIAETGKGQSNRVRPDADGHNRGDADPRQQGRHGRPPPGEFDRLDDEPHLIDLRA